MAETTGATKRCKRCGSETRPETYVGDLGWCSAICMNLDEIEAVERTVRARMHLIVGGRQS